MMVTLMAVKNFWKFRRKITRKKTKKKRKKNIKYDKTFLQI